MSIDLNAVFCPQSIAVVGASTNPDKLGSVILRNILEAGFAGPVYPINPKASEIAGRLCFPSVSAVGQPVDQVTICIPAAGVWEVVQDCIQAQVKSIIIISAGFGETGPEGKQLEEQIAQACREHDIALVGPNVIGVIHPDSKLNNSWMQTMPAAGGIAFVSQSGALCCSVLDMASRYGLGFSHFCSLGNKAGIDELDLVRAWLEDEQVQVMAAYLEDIRYGSKLVGLLARNPSKPLVVFHSGKTASARSAVASHTGSIAGGRELVSTALRQAGIIEATTIREFYLYLRALGHHDNEHLPYSGKVAVITNAGGAGIIATDELVGRGLELASLPAAVTKQLRAVLPASASVRGPIDVLGDAPAERYTQALEALLPLGEDDLGPILVILTPQYVTQPEQTAQAIIDFRDQHPERVVLAAFLGDESVRAAAEQLSAAGIEVFDDLSDAVSVAAMLVRRGKWVHQFHNSIVARTYRKLILTKQGRFHALIDATVGDQPQVLEQRVTKMLAAEVGLDLPEEKLISSVEEACEFARAHFPVVLKAPNEAIVHKTDCRAIFTNLRSEAEVTAAFEQLQQMLTHLQPKGRLPLILIQEMVSGQLEFFIGAQRDGSSDVYAPGQRGFGHLLTFGQGGIYTEISHDHNFALVPERRRNLKEDLWETQVFQIIAGARGQQPLPEPKIMDSIMRVQRLCILYPEIVSLDINPLLVTPERAIAVDIKIFLGR